jgi:Mn-dependent DtxR family transcriptional regulator
MNLVEMVLAAVEERGEVCISEIADAMQIPASIVVDVFRKLEADGLLQTL